MFPRIFDLDSTHCGFEHRGVRFLVLESSNRQAGRAMYKGDARQILLGGLSDRCFGHAFTRPLPDPAPERQERQLNQFINRSSEKRLTFAPAGLD